MSPILNFISKRYFMNTHKGKPSGDPKEENQQKSKPSEKLHTHTRLSTEKYIDEEGLDETVKPKHPNRNTRKEKATNSHGYKN